VRDEQMVKLTFYGWISMIVRLFQILESICPKRPHEEGESIIHDKR